MLENSWTSKKCRISTGRAYDEREKGELHSKSLLSQNCKQTQVSCSFISVQPPTKTFLGLVTHPTPQRQECVTKS